ncbi:MAG: UDP-2,3-diacylglucosamine diphosphatase [Porticoccaceae bacterium]|nr:UDP-2,3-diacylglucosamine diphosphatase [Porticoccaceae bacterium]
MKTLLISDLHLSPERPAVTAAFSRFLKDRASHCEALYILGDLFEAWIGDDDPAELSQSVIAELKALSDNGVSVYFLHGNRDFAIGRRFARESGCHLLKELHLVDFYGEKVLLLHGDTLCTEDVEYQRARRLIRNPLLLMLAKRLPLKTRQKIAIKGREKSRASTSNKSDYIMDVSQTTVATTLLEQGVTTMIHGHTHRPGDHRFKLETRNGTREARRMVLGDWGDKGWVIEASSAGLQLEPFPT